MTAFYSTLEQQMEKLIKRNIYIYLYWAKHFKPKGIWYSTSDVH